MKRLKSASTYDPRSDLDRAFRLAIAAQMLPVLWRYGKEAGWGRRACVKTAHALAEDLIAYDLSVNNGDRRTDNE